VLRLPGCWEGLQCEEGQLSSCLFAASLYRLPCFAIVLVSVLLARAAAGALDTAQYKTVKIELKDMADHLLSDTFFLDKRFCATLAEPVH
jgi:hypothetical protein